VQILNRQQFHKGKPVFSAGDAATCAYLIQSGHIDIVVGKGDDAVVIDTLGPGEIFGEMALLDDGVRSAGAFARDSVTCIVITRSEFQKHLEAADPLTRAMLKLMTKRLRKVTRLAQRAA
jgi:CRP-like cAMP-binding protein